MKKQYSLKELKDHPVISHRGKLNISQRASDVLTNFLGSWKFLTLFFAFLLVWMSLNVYAWVSHWDPYPFILLNLALSCLAAFQAPIILMSQNRQTERDRIEARYDYAVNRKIEREAQAMQKDLASIKRMLRSLGASSKAKK